METFGELAGAGIFAFLCFSGLAILIMSLKD